MCLLYFLTVSVLLGDGRGGLQNAPGSPFSAGAKPWEVAVGNLNGDGNADLIVIPYQRDISSPDENVVTILLGDGHGGFRPRPGTPLSLGNCRGANSVTTGDITGDGTQTIVVVCAESRTMCIYHRAADGNFTATTQPIAGGWGSVAIARLTADQRGAIIIANSDAGSITICFPDHLLPNKHTAAESLAPAATMAVRAAD
jgi:hypothetical protein